MKLYRLALNKEGAEPTLAIPDIKPLLAPCAQPGPGIDPYPCTQVDLFHPYWDNTDGTGQLAFAYAPWSASGMPAGNTALAMLDSNGKIRLLTYNRSDINTMDHCPRFVQGTNGTSIIFLRALEDGAHLVPSHLNIITGAISVLVGEVPEADGWGGCPAAVNNKFLYITANESDTTVEAIEVESGSAHQFRYSASEAFSTPRVSTPSTKDSLAFQYCSAVSGDDVIACLTAAPEHKVSIKDPATGQTHLNLTIPMPATYDWFETANSFHVLAN